MKKFLSLFGILVGLGAVGFLGFSTVAPRVETFSPHSVSAEATSTDSETDFIIDPKANKNAIAKQLYGEGYIHSPLGYAAFKVLTFFKGSFEAGAYRISKSMGVVELYQNLANPFMKYVNIPEGLRKEEIADRLAKAFNWNEKEKRAFLNLSSTTDIGITEGIYFPDTYLLPIYGSSEGVGKKMINAFNENIALPYEDGPKNVVSLQTILTVASLIQREAAGKKDMPIISGIIWNRLFANWPLQIDATLQYAKGTPAKWWPKVTPQDKKIDSPYNTYLNKGLPPGPIANPGEDAINAALHPKKTSCFFYLHDDNGGFHCTKTYAEHELNIERYFGKNLAKNTKK